MLFKHRDTINSFLEIKGVTKKAVALIGPRDAKLASPMLWLNSQLVFHILTWYNAFSSLMGIWKTYYIFHTHELAWQYVFFGVIQTFGLIVPHKKSHGTQNKFWRNLCVSWKCEAIQIQNCNEDIFGHLWRFLPQVLQLLPQVFPQVLPQVLLHLHQAVVSRQVGQAWHIVTRAL